MPPTVRSATPADAAVIIEFNRRLAQETEGKTLDGATLAAGVAAVLADPVRGRYYLAEDDGAPLAQLMITTEWSDWRNGWFWWIQSVYVREDARRRGLFRLLYEYVREQAQADGAVIGLRLYVEHANRPAQDAYRRLGLDATGYLLLERYPL